MNAVLTAVGLVSSPNPDKYVDGNAVLRQRKKLREENKKISKIKSIFFDAKQVSTIVPGGKKLLVEHMVMIAESGGNFIGSCTPQNKTAKDVGYKGGVKRLLEEHIGRKCHWIVSINIYIYILYYIILY